MVFYFLWTKRFGTIFGCRWKLLNSSGVWVYGLFWLGVAPLAIDLHPCGIRFNLSHPFSIGEISLKGFLELGVAPLAIDLHPCGIRFNLSHPFSICELSLKGFLEQAIK